MSPTETGDGAGRLCLTRCGMRRLSWLSQLLLLLFIDVVSLGTWVSLGMWLSLLLEDRESLKCFEGEQEKLESSWRWAQN